MITTKADYQKRVVLPQASPGQVYAVQENTDGALTPSLVSASESIKPTCLVAKEEGFTVAVPEQPINVSGWAATPSF